LCEAGADEIVDPGWSIAQGQLGENSQDPQVCYFFGPTFVVSAGVEKPTTLRVPAAFTELALAI
jgi:hypothetical protein